MSTHPQFSIAGRADDVARRWNVFIQPGYQDTGIFHQIATDLYTIPITPLPTQSIAGDSEEVPEPRIHDSEFFDTWHAFQQTLAEYGTICYSRFQSLQLFAEDHPASLRMTYGLRIDVKLPDNWVPQFYFIAYVHANGRVRCFGMDEPRYQTFSS